MTIPILIAVAVIVVVFVIIVALQPADFRVTRTVNIAAPAAVVFAQVNDLHKWEAWSPWEKIDPALKKTFEGAPAGPGAIYRWTGNNKVGKGSMTITESKPDNLVRLRVEFLKPFKATNIAEFTFKPKSNQTVVSWSMTGKKVCLTKVIGLFISMDKMCGGQFEKGLGQLKAVAEATS